MLDDLQKALCVNQKVEVTVWDPKDDSVELYYHSYVIDVKGAYLMIAPPNENAEKIVPLMQVGYVVGIVLDTYPNPYIFYPVIHAVPDQPGSGFWLKIQENAEVETLQRRRHVRIPMVLPIEVEYPMGPQLIRVEGHTEDVSGGGLKFTSQKLFNKGQKIRVRLQFSSETELLRLDGEVVMSMENRVRRKPEDEYVTACQFYDLDNRKEMMIVRECFRRELGHKR
jgi:c-di-GMP-binding flagellar brake protein YcgR